MMMEDDQITAWREHINQYAKCPSCGADGELEGTCDVVDPEKPGEPVYLRERMNCPACGCSWWERCSLKAQTACSNSPTDSRNQSSPPPPNSASPQHWRCFPMTDYTERARAFIQDIGLDADWADHEVVALAAEFAAVAEEQREADAGVCDALRVSEGYGSHPETRAAQSSFVLCAAAIRRQP